MNNQNNDFTLLLNQRDAIGLYISLKRCDADLNGSGMRVIKKLEEYLFNFLTIDQFAHIEDIYVNL